MSFRLAELLDLEPGPEFSLHGFTVRRSFKPVDLDQICRFRYEVYESEGYLAPGAFPGGALKDRFDAAAEHIVAFDRKGAIGGSMRVSLPAGGLPTLGAFNIQVAQYAQRGLIDIGKFAIVKKYRARLLLPILKAAIESAISHKAPYILAFCPDRLAQSYLDVGCPSFPVPELPPPPRMQENRAPMQPYFERAKVKPRVFSIRQILLGMDLNLPLYLRRSPDFNTLHEPARVD